jgi:hypothetical protein
MEAPSWYFLNPPPLSQPWLDVLTKQMKDEDDKLIREMRQINSCVFVSKGKKSK